MIHKAISKLIRYLPLILLLSTYSCQQSVDSKLNRAEQLMENHPDSALYILQGFQDDYSALEDHNKALFGLLLFKASNNNMEKEHPPLDYIDYSIDYFKRSNQVESLAYSYYYRARIYKNKREYKEAIENLLNASALISEINDDELTGKIYFELGHLSGIQNEIDKAIDFLDKSLVHFRNADNDNLSSKVFLLKGWIYMSQNEFESAIESSKEALRITSDSIIMGDVLNDIGSSYYFKEQFDSAVYYIRKSLHYPYYDTNLSSRYYNLANVYSYQNQYDSAIYYVNKAMEYPIDIYFEEECYRILTKIAIAQNDKDNITGYMAKREACQDSIRKLEQQPKISVLEHIHYSDAEKKRIEKNNFRLYIAIIALLIVAGVVILFLYKRNREKVIKTETYQEEIKKHEEQLSDLSEELQHKHLYLVREVNYEIRKTRKKHYPSRKRARSMEEREKIDKRIYEEVLHTNNEKMFLEKMNTVLNNLPDKLRKEYPFINYKEIMWCCLFMLGLPTADIALLLGMKHSSQYKFKQRLAKKLNLDKVKELEDLLKERTTQSN